METSAIQCSPFQCLWMSYGVRGECISVDALFWPNLLVIPRPLAMEGHFALPRPHVWPL